MRKVLTALIVPVCLVLGMAVERIAIEHLQKERQSHVSPIPSTDPKTSELQNNHFISTEKPSPPDTIEQCFKDGPSFLEDGSEHASFCQGVFYAMARFYYVREGEKGWHMYKWNQPAK